MQKGFRMSWQCWLANYLLMSLFFKWLLLWGGAEWVEGWRAGFTMGWLASLWSSEQIRLYALLMWIIVSLVFAWGLFVPEMREYGQLFGLPSFFCQKK